MWVFQPFDIIIRWNLTCSALTRRQSIVRLAGLNRPFEETTGEGWQIVAWLVDLTHPYWPIDPIGVTCSQGKNRTSPHVPGSN